MSKSNPRRGAISGKPPDNTKWVWLTDEMVRSTTWGALSISARRILDALIVENLSHGGRENGDLAVTYRQLEAFGVTKVDISRGLAELQICGFVRLVKPGLRVAGGGDPARYALTWLVTFLGSPAAAIPTDDWRDVVIKRNRAGQTTTLQVRRWLKEQVDKAHVGRGSKTRNRSAAVPVTQDIEGAPQLRADDRDQVRGDRQANVVVLTPHLRGGLGSK